MNWWWVYNLVGNRWKSGEAMEIATIGKVRIPLRGQSQSVLKKHQDGVADASYRDGCYNVPLDKIRLTVGKDRQNGPLEQRKLALNEKRGR